MANQINVEVSKDLSRGSLGLENEGTFHLVVTSVNATPVKRFGPEKGQMVDGFEVGCQVLHGTAQHNDRCLEEGKQIAITFNNPSLSSKDQGEFSRRKQSRFLSVIGLVKDSDVGAKIRVDLDAALHRQFIAKFSETLDKDKKKTGFIDLHFADMWHVDDPSVHAVPKSAEWLGTLPAEQRQEGAKAAKPKDLPGQKTMFSEPVEKAAAKTGKVDVSDL